MELVISVKEWKVIDEIGFMPIFAEESYIADRLGLPDNVVIRVVDRKSISDVDKYIKSMLYSRYGFYPLLYTWAEK